MADQVDDTYEQPRLLTHQEYVQSGYCPSVNGKMWCFGVNGHTGKHHALSLRLTKDPEYVTWDS